MLKGYLAVMNGDVKQNLNGIFTVFIPTRNKEIVLDMIRGNGDVISIVEYEVDLNELTEDEKKIVTDRMYEVHEYYC